MSSMNAPDLKPQDVSKERLRLWLKILKVSRHVEAELRERMRLNHDSTLPRFDVLAALYRFEKGLRMSQLSGVLRVSNGNVTGVVDRLVEEGNVLRAPVEGDRRATVVRLTEKGRARFRELAEDHEAWVNDLLSGLDADEVAAAIEMLSGISGKPEDEGAH